MSNRRRKCTPLYARRSELRKEEKIAQLRERLGYPEHQHVERPSTHEVFMNVAFEVSKRSNDAQTQHGCVIVTPEGRILSTGYNGLPRGLDNELLPNIRPFKYSWYRHSERNALAWCEKRPLDCIAYVTGECCNECLMTMWQHGIKEVYEADRHGSATYDEESRNIRELFLLLSDMKIHKMPLRDQNLGV